MQHLSVFCPFLLPFMGWSLLVSDLLRQPADPKYMGIYILSPFKLPILKGTNMQQSGHVGPIFKTEKTKEI